LARSNKNISITAPQDLKKYKIGAIENMPGKDEVSNPTGSIVDVAPLLIPLMLITAWLE